jgi:hypothetical protein
MARLNLLEETRFEKLSVSVYPDQHTASIQVAKRIAQIIRKKTRKQRTRRVRAGNRRDPHRRICRTAAHAPRRGT